MVNEFDDAFNIDVKEPEGATNAFDDAFNDTDTEPVKTAPEVNEFDSAFDTSPKISALDTKMKKSIDNVDQMISLFSGMEEGNTASQLVAGTSGKYPSQWLGADRGAVKEAQKNHPGWYTGGQVVSAIPSLASLYGLSGPVGMTVASKLGRIPFLSPAMQTMAKIGLSAAGQRIPAHVANAGLHELAKGRADKNLDAGTVAGSMAKAGAFGAALSPMGFIPKTFPRVLTAGFVGGGWAATEKLMKKGNLTKEDIPGIAGMALIIGGAEFLGSAKVSQIRKEAMDNAWRYEIAKSKYIGKAVGIGTGPTVKEAEKEWATYVGTMKVIQQTQKAALLNAKAGNPNMSPDQQALWNKNWMLANRDYVGNPTEGRRVIQQVSNVQKNIAETKIGKQVSQYLGNIAQLQSMSPEQISGVSIAAAAVAPQSVDAFGISKGENAFDKAVEDVVLNKGGTASKITKEIANDVSTTSRLSQLDDEIEMVTKDVKKLDTKIMNNADKVLSNPGSNKITSWHKATDIYSREKNDKVAQIERLQERRIALLEGREAQTIGEVEPVSIKQGVRTAFNLGQRSAREIERNKAKAQRDELFIKFRAKNHEVAEIKEDLYKYAKDRLEPQDQGKLLARVGTVKTKQQLYKAFVFVEKVAENRARRDAVGDLKKTVTKIDLKKARPEYKAEFESIIKAVNLINTSEGKITKLQSRLGYLLRQEDHNVPESKINEIDALYKKNINDLTTDDIQTLNDGLKHFAHQQNTKNKLIFGRKQIDAKAISQKAVENIYRAKDQKNLDPNIISTKERIPEIGILRNIFDLKSINMETLTEDDLDAGKGGANWSILFKGIKDGKRKELSNDQMASDFFSVRLQGIDVSRWSELFTPNPSEATIDYQKLDLPSGLKLILTPGEKIAIYLHSLNRTNLRNMINKGGGISFKRTETKIKALSMDDVIFIKDSMTPEEQKVAETMSEYLNTIQKDLINETSVNLDGYEKAIVDMYFPEWINPEAIAKNALVKEGSLRNKILEGTGMLNERKKGIRPLIIEDAFPAVFKVIKIASAYNGLAEPLRNAKMLVQDKDWRKAVMNTRGREYIKTIETYLKDVESNSYDLAEMDKLTLDLINKVDIAVLGLNPWVMLKQLPSYFFAATEIDMKYLLEAATNPMSMEEMAARDPEMRDRSEGHVTREMGEVANVGAVRSFWTKQKSLSQNMMNGIRNFDMQVVGRIWRAAELEVEDKHKGLSKEAKHKMVNERAMEIVRKTQPTFSVEDRSEIGRIKTPLIKLATKYMSQRNKIYMMIRRAIKEYNRSAGTDADKAKLIFKLIMVTFVGSSLIWMANKLRDFAYGRETKNWGADFGLSTIENNLSTVYGVGTLFSSLRSKIERGQFAGYDISNILFSTLDSGIDSMASLSDAVRFSFTKEKYKSGKHKGQKKWLRSAINFADDATSVASRFKGIPYDTVKRLTLGLSSNFTPKKKTRGIR